MTKPKPRPPRPVRAWAPGLPDGGLSVEQGQVPVFLSRRDAKFDCEMANDGSKPVRVTVVPDGATSAEAEARKLRRLVLRLRAVLTREVGRGFDKCDTKAKKRACPWRSEHRLRDEIDAALRRKGGSR